MKKRVCFATSTRADWGLLQPLALALRDGGGVEVQVLATNMHLMPRYGYTVGEIEAAGFAVDASVPVDVQGDDDASRVHVMAQCMAGAADAFARLRPDAVVILGDRYEMLAIASSAATMHIPVIHIAGGEISEGALDDAFRHAITKLSTLHLTATEPYRRRVIQMGEAPDRVVNTGAIGVWNAMNIKAMTRAELSADLGFDLDRPFALVTYHPATNDLEASPAERAGELLVALDAFPGLAAIITYPNNDAHGAHIIDRLTAYAASRRDRVLPVQSLGMLRYHSLLRLASVVVGNSSSGIVEAPSAGVPTVDIGMRQRGRMAGPSVIHCGDDAASIREAIARALSPDMQALAARRQNPYGSPGTLGRMTDAVLAFVATLPCPPKTFYDIEY